MNTSIGLSIAGSVGCRYLLSVHDQIPKRQALVFNTIDMTVNALVTPYFMKGMLGAIAPGAAVFAARSVSFLCAAITTTALVGPLNLSHACVLSFTSLVIGFILRAATLPDQGDSLDRFMAV